jgi:hypothetical protein
VYRIGVGGTTTSGVLASTGFDALAIVCMGLVAVVVGLALIRVAVLRRH